MAILSYQHIVALTANRRAQGEWSFTPDEYQTILRSCEKDKVLAKMLSAYPPQDFERLFQVARERALAAAATNNREISVHDSVFAPGRQATAVWLVSETPELDTNIIKSELQTTYKEQLVQTFESEVRSDLIKKIYTDASESELNDHEIDFRDFIDYIFGNYNNGATGAENLVRALNWSLNPVDAETKNDRLHAFFGSLNFGRTSYKDYAEKLIKANSPYAKGRDRNWSCMAGVDERILDGLLLLRDSLQDNHNPSEQNTPIASLEDAYLQSLVHEFIRRTPDGFLPSAELYSAYLQAILPPGYNAIVATQPEYRLSILEDEQQVLATIAQGTATQQYQKIINIGKALLQEEGASEQACLLALSRAGNSSSAIDIDDYSLIKSFFSEDAGTPARIIKGAFRSFLAQNGFNLDVALTHKTVPEFQDQLKERLNKNAEKNIQVMLQRTFENKSDAVALLEKLQHPDIQITSTTKKALAVTNPQGDAVHFDEFMFMISELVDKRILQERISNNTGMSREWLDLLNTFFKREGVDLWEICYKLVEQQEAKIVEQGGQLNTELLNQRISEQKDNLIILGKQHLDEHPNNFFCYYAADHELIEKLSTSIKQNLGEIPVEFLDITALNCDEQTLLKCLEIGLWDILEQEEKNNFIKILVKENYEQAFNSDNINLDEVTGKEQLLEKALVAGKFNLVKKIIESRALNINHKYLRDKTALMLSAENGWNEIVSLLLRKDGLALNQKDRHGKTALMYAVQNGHTEVVSLLSQQEHVNINDKDYQNLTALKLAIITQNSAIVSILLQRTDLDLNEKDTQEPLLMLAISLGKLEIVSLLLKHENLNINEKDGYHETALMLAVQAGNAAIAYLLLKHNNLNINQQNLNGETAFMMAVARNNSEIVSLFLENPALDINVKDRYGENAFMKAVSKGHYESVSLLLQKADLKINEQDRDGNTALMLGIQSGNDSIITFMLHKGASINQKNKASENALMMAARLNRISIASLLLQKEGLNTNEMNDRHETALMIAVEHGHIQIVSLLLEKNDLELNTKNEKYDTALMVALKKGHNEIASLLIQNDRLDINARNYNCLTTALILAAEKGNAYVVSLLLQRDDLNLNAQNINNTTALMVALRHGQTDIVTLLLQKDGLNLDLEDHNYSTAFKLAKYNPYVLQLLHNYADKQSKKMQINPSLEQGHSLIYSYNAQSSNQISPNKKPNSL